MKWKLLNIANLLLVLLINNGCEKEPFVITLEATGITNTTAILRASTIPQSDDLYLEFEYGETHDYSDTIRGIGLAESGGIISYEIGILKSGQTYYFRALLKSLKNINLIMYGDEVKFTTTVKDQDGNGYNIVTIGTQTWMKENLRTTRLNDGTAIRIITGAHVGSGLNTPGYCWYDNNINYRNTYGALYNWHAVTTNNLCPAGWHLPSVEEWGGVVAFLGENSGGAMKEGGTVHWNSPNSGATNTSGFTGMAGGMRSSDGNFYGLGNYGHWWSCRYEELFFYDPAQAYHFSVSSVFELSFNSVTGGLKEVGYSDCYSVRCIRD